MFTSRLIIPAAVEFWALIHSKAADLVSMTGIFCRIVSIVTEAMLSLNIYLTLLEGVSSVKVRAVTY